jgi:two-component system, OmpR family, sensor histidine kinase ArlS
MNSLRIRFAIGFWLLFALLFTASLYIVYAFYTNFRKQEFYNRLKDRAITTYRLLIEVEQIDKQLLQVIDQNTLNSLSDEKMLIFENGRLIYSGINDNKLLYSDSLLSVIRLKKELLTMQGTAEVVGVAFRENGKEYILLAAAFDKHGKRTTEFLQWILLGVYVAGLLLGGIVTWFFVKKIMRPLEVLTKNVQVIDYENLDKRLTETGQGEEVNNLAANFNRTLDRLQRSIGFQKDFIHYASHELRTPLTAMVTITQNAMKEVEPAHASQSFFAQLFQQQKNLTEITSSLLFLSDSNLNASNNEYPLIRLDELLFRSVEIIKNLFPDGMIDINFRGELSNEEYLLINANEPLLLMLFNNLIKNALQYSPDQSVVVVLELSAEARKVSFRNKGTRLSEEEAGRLYTPFFRGNNVGPVKGFGLGLSLVKKIADLHQAKLDYCYENGLNDFTIYFPGTYSNLRYDEEAH